MNYAFQFLQRFEKFSHQYELISPGDQIVVAVSGGLDSVVLLHCLIQLMPKLDLKLLAAHFNHQLRGKESDQDEQFVIDIARREQIRCITNKGNVNQFADERQISVEMAARELRYQFLETVRKDYQFDKIATGHQANDQAETVLQNLFRGAGWNGLAGIPKKRNSIIRPLLFAYRKELQRIASETGLPYRTDHSNFSLIYQRNRTRHRLIPFLEQEFNPNMIEQINQFAKMFQEGDEFLQHQAKKTYQDCLKYKSAHKIILEIDRFCSYFTIIKKYVLFHLFNEIGVLQDAISHKRLSTILSVIQNRRFGKFLLIAGNWQIGVDHSGIVIFSESEIKPVHVHFKVGDLVTIPERGIKISSEKVDPNQVVFNNNLHIEYINGDRVSNCEFEIRSICPGDRFFPLGVNYSQKLSDFFINQKIPVWDRKRALVLVNKKAIVWVIGYRLDNRFRVTSGTKNVIKLKAVND